MAQVGATRRAVFFKKTPRHALVVFGFFQKNSPSRAHETGCYFFYKIKSNWLGRSRFDQKRSIFDHSSPFFESDVPHRTQKIGSIGQKSPAFFIQNR
jgi:hypothetical protein